MDKLRSGRLARLQMMMKQYSMPICLFFNPANIRYATGTDVMGMRIIKEHSILCLECYAGKVGAPYGVKLEDQVLVTKDGAQLLSTYPYDVKLLN
jgi:Xaa-Pro aminopeptidase